MSDINYYEKYIKYKNKYKYLKYILLGSGKNAIIKFFYSNIKDPATKQSIELDVTKPQDERYKLFSQILKRNLRNPELIFTVEVTDDDGIIESFIIDKYLSEGANGAVFKTRDNKIIKITLQPNNRMIKEGRMTEELCIKTYRKALYQGAQDIGFIIYNYLGESLEKFIKETHRKLKFYFSIFNNLFDQIYKLNKHNYFHNDVKIGNCIFYKSSLILIDWELTERTSYIGSYDSLCLFGCAYYLRHKFSSNMSSNGISDISIIIEESSSTDIVGFFNFIIDCLFIYRGINITSYKIFQPILNLKGDFSFNDIIKILCFFSILSQNRNVYRIISTFPFCQDIIRQIETKLCEIRIDESLLPDGIRVNDDNRCIICYAFIIFSNLEFRNKKQFLFIFNLVYECFNSRFDLENFKLNISRVLDKSLLE